MPAHNPTPTPLPYEGTAESGDAPSIAGRSAPPRIAGGA